MNELSSTCTTRSTASPVSIKSSELQEWIDVSNSNSKNIFSSSSSSTSHFPSACCSCCCFSSSSSVCSGQSTVAMVVCNAAAVMLPPSVVPAPMPPLAPVPQFIAASVPQPPVPQHQTLTATVTGPPIPPTPAFWTNQAYGMEAVWFGEFLRQFQRYPQRWHFVPTGSRPTGPHWEEFRDGAKVRFCCQECGHGWTSMKGRVMFWFYLDAYLNEGWIMFQLFGQKCLKCNTTRFENAMWYPEEVVKVVTNICSRVAEGYYGYPQFLHRSVRRPGRPRNPHNRDLCQACHEGVCNEKR